MRTQEQLQHPIGQWDIRLVCNTCGYRARRCVQDLMLRGDMPNRSARPPAVVEEMCAVCDYVTLHFVDLEIDVAW